MLSTQVNGLQGCRQVPRRMAASRTVRAHSASTALDGQRAGSDYACRVARRIAPSSAPTSRRVLRNDLDGTFGIFTARETTPAVRPVPARVDPDDAWLRLLELPLLAIWPPRSGDC